jgi:hypothetical protein
VCVAGSVAESEMGGTASDACRTTVAFAGTPVGLSYSCFSEGNFTFGGSIYRSVKAVLFLFFVSANDCTQASFIECTVQREYLGP